ncbi:MAG: S1C family serine protease [Gemmatimonadales bacterium]
MQIHAQPSRGPERSPLATRLLAGFAGLLLVVGNPAFARPLAALPAVQAQATDETPGAARTDDARPADDGSSVASAPANLEELSEMATAAVVLIEVELGKRSRQGSGFIVSQDGLILTNYHVIRDATDARVRLASGDVYDRVSVMATDERRDLAVLKVSGFSLPTLALGNSDSVHIGMDVVAIGSPMGLENTVSTGIVSGRRTEPRGFRLLQISAPASTGSSGGPVLTRDGQVIGIAASQFRSGQNLNFAVPINYARGMLSEVDGEPLAVLGATAPLSASDDESETAETDTNDRVNGGLRFDLSGFRDHRLGLSLREPGGAERRTTVTYRRIEDIAGGEPRIERYEVSESVVQDDPAAPGRTIRRERRRSLVSAVDMAPSSSRGEIEWEVDGQWFRRAWDLRFDDGHVTGTVEDSAGVVRQVDRELPRGIVLRGMRDLAFGGLVADPLVGRSMELHTFDAELAELRIDRFDIRHRTTLEMNGAPEPALAVDVASGLANQRTYYTTEVPRRLLRREFGESGAVEEVVSYGVIPREAEAPAP